MPYEMQFRVAVAAAHRACGSSAEVAEEFGCSESWVRRLMQVERETGSLAPKPAQRPDNNKLDDADMERIAQLIKATPDITLAELAAALGNKVSTPTLCRAAKRLGLSRKSTRPVKCSWRGPTLT